MRSTALILLAVVAAAPLAAQETRFTPQLSSGERLYIENVNGEVEVTQGNGRTAEIVVTKIVKRGDGNLVKAIMEDVDGGVRVCTIYLNRDPNRNSCKGNNSTDSRRGDRFEIEMHYVVRLPAGVRLDAETVNGGIRMTGLDAPARAETVNGGITFDGSSASSLSTVNGSIRGTFTRANWEGTLKIETVNGGVDLTFPASLNAEVRGETVNGGMSSDFPITVEGKWGPKSMRGTIGNGGRMISIETVNGGITLRKR